MNGTNQMIWVWLLVSLATTFSFINLFLFYKILKKFDDSQLLIDQAFQLLNDDRIRILKEIDNLKRRGRILNNEAKEKRGRED